MKKAFLIIALLTTSIINSTLADENDPSGCLKKLDEILQKIPSKKIAELVILKEKLAILEAVMNASHNQNQSEIQEPREVCCGGICCISAQKPQAEIDAEAHWFQPTPPKPLTQEEAAKSVRQRIQEKFIGTLPDQADRLIALFTEQQNDSQQSTSSLNHLLITGDTGTGKTHLAEVLIQELQVKSISIPSCRFGNKYCGEGSRRIQEVFKNAKALNEPVIIFIDHIDAIAFKMRNTSHPEYKHILKTLLTELENVQNNKNVFVIFVTDRPDLLDRTFTDKFPGTSHAKLSYLNEEERAARYK